ncbi:MAG TPA: AMP-binding protein, partial [Chloroflexota bacterium]|jgi:fatty-acyl-CoA synthase|nr:AMP-binding protein [Chloroflexota bacterium]
VVFAGTEFLETADLLVSAIQVIESSEGAASYRELLLQPPAQPAIVNMSDPWLILYTGGTTGAPKGAVLTHGSITWNSINTCVSWGLSHDDVGPVFTPAFHTGFWNVFTLPLLLVGGRVLIAERFDPARALNVIVTKRPSILFLVPTMFQQLAETPGFDTADMSSLRWAISGGAPLPQPVADRWRAKVRDFKQGYGLTEVGPNNFATPDGTTWKPGTVGRLTAFAHARIVDDNGADVDDGVTGELLLAGPHMCAGYWRRPKATEEAIRNGWFATGDMARRDEDGFYYIVDRKKDMIITGGENVYPIEVEMVLYEHECVREVAVVGVPDAVWGEAVTAVVSLTPGRGATADALKEFARERLARYKVPKEFVLVEEVPKTGANKLSRVEARKLALSIRAVDAGADHRPEATPMIPSRGGPK